MRNLAFIGVLAIMMFACNNEKKETTEVSKDVNQGVVTEVLHVREYSYILVDENGQEKWIAAPITQVQQGNTIYYGKAMLMENFESKDLNKTFDKVYFVENVSSTEDGLKQAPAAAATPAADPHAGMNIEASQAQKPAVEKKAVEVKKVEGAITLAELFQNKEKYKGQKVIVTGQVTKFNPMIMNTNWIHLQDGSEYQGEFDLTITTDEQLNVGDQIVLQGEVVLNKDFGAGYYYKVLLEKGKLIQ